MEEEKVLTCYPNKRKERLITLQKDTELVNEP